MAIYWKADSEDPIGPESLALRYIRHYPHLMDATLLFLYKDKASINKDGTPMVCKVNKVSAKNQAIIQAVLDMIPVGSSRGDAAPPDFVIEVGEDAWTELGEVSRCAEIDQCLAQCHGEEDEKTGEIKFSKRNFTIQSFPEIIGRHGTGWQAGMNLVFDQDATE